LFIHSAFVLHRDIKPSNILLFRDSIKNQQLTLTAKICDFGLAKYDTDISQTTITDATAGKGTLAYMAPELLYKRPINYSTKSDIYAYAITLNEVLLEERPYANLVQIQPTDRPILTSIPGVTGDSLRALITSSWSDEISTRPSFNYIYQELSNIFQEVVFETNYGSRASRSYLFGSSIKHQQQYEYQYQQNQGMISNIEVSSEEFGISFFNY
jgi:serine/threonine protein kinase